jgi:hypothetical protein
VLEEQVVLEVSSVGGGVELAQRMYIKIKRGKNYCLFWVLASNIVNILDYNVCLSKH